MALQLNIDGGSYEGLDESVKGLYVEHDGGWKLDVDGVEDVSGLKSALERQKADAKLYKKKAKDLESRISGLDLDMAERLVSQAESEAEKRLLAEGKLDEVVAQRVERYIKAKDGEIEARDGRIKSLSDKALESALMSAASKAGVHRHAIDDVLLRAKTIFTLDDNGEPVQLGADGSPVLGKDGKSNFSPSEWIGGMVEKAPHWFPASSSGTGFDDNQGGHNGKTKTRAEFDPMSPADKAKFVKDGGTITP